LSVFLLVFFGDVMICISIAQESRRLVLADMLNASRQCDLLEVRLDRFAKAADVGELLANKPRPVILSCRRPQDGGDWQGSETERLALLRQCIISKADYVEIELDAADEIRKFPPTKRVISYTNFQETPADLPDIYREMQTKSPDVIKLVTLARTPEEAWPLLQILAKPALPTVVVGLGKPGVMLTVLGKKIGAPWTYAALERGMEVYPGQPTVQDLNDVYHYQAINRSTRLIGVTGLSDLAPATSAVLNAAFAHLGQATRCWPVQVGNMQLFRKIIDAVKLTGVVVDEEHRSSILEIATELTPEAQEAQAADLILHQEKKWQGYNLLGRAAVTALEGTLRGTAADRPLHARPVMIVGANPAAWAVAFAVKRRGGLPIIASRDKNDGLRLAQAIDGRHVQFEGLYSTMHDVLIVCSEEKVSAKARATEAGVHPGYLKASMTVMDLTALPRMSVLLRDAAARGCTIVPPRQVLLEHALLQLPLISGQQVPREPLEAVLGKMVDEE
jgi:3-dehydroquinate dehydratase/shikimate dehydrogenase